MFWKKESNKPDALYLDIFAIKRDEWLFGRREIPHVAELDESMFRKSDFAAQFIRKKGNAYFGKGQWCDAMKAYSDSLCMAPIGSPNISLAFANRSACFFHAKMYNECLVDIELAKTAGYPEHLMPKLDRRIAECLKCIDEEGAAESDDYGLKLSYDPDEKLPCLANVLKFDRDADGEYGIYAKEDIEVGKTILVEQAFSTHLLKQYGWRCNICLKANTNLVPCEKCTRAMFCNDGCNKHYLHEFECGRRPIVGKEANESVMLEVRVILKVVHMFSNADELMDFVEQTIASDRNKPPENLSNEKEKYRAYLKLPVHSMTEEDQRAIVLGSWIAYNILWDIQKVKSMFQSEKHRRFLMHLITLHSQVSEKNSLQMPVRNYSVDDCKIICAQPTIMRHFFKHSCLPNVMLECRNGKLIGITIRPVRGGEQLLNSNLDKRKREDCSQCEKTAATHEQRQTLAADPDYKSVLSGKKFKDELHIRLALMEKCAAFLNKHGHNLWCPELAEAIRLYFTLWCFRMDDPMGRGEVLDVDY